MDRRQIAASERGLGLSIPKLLYAVMGAPVLWALHLNAVYFLLTLDCISAWDGGRWAIAAATIVLGIAAAAAGWIARSMYRELGGEDVVGPERGWARFLLVLGMGAAVIFTATIVLEGAAPFFTELCP